MNALRAREVATADAPLHLCAGDDRGDVAQVCGRRPGSLQRGPQSVAVGVLVRKR